MLIEQVQDIIHLNLLSVIERVMQNPKQLQFALLQMIFERKTMPNSKAKLILWLDSQVETFLILIKINQEVLLAN